MPEEARIESMYEDEIYVDVLDSLFDTDFQSVFQCWFKNTKIPKAPRLSISLTRISGSYKLQG